MREELQARDGKRGKFTATFARFGSKTAYKGPMIKTALFRDIKDESGEIVTDHLWFTVGKQMEALNLTPDDRVAFEARVKPYRKGYRGHRDYDDDMPAPSVDYRLAWPTKMRVLKVVGPALPIPEGGLFDGTGDLF